MDMMKRTLLAAVAVFAMTSASAMAQGVKMSDQQLDEITAAGAAVLIANSGNAVVDRNGVCINCDTLSPAPVAGRTGGAVTVFNKKFDAGFTKCIAGGVSAIFSFMGTIQTIQICP